MDNPIDNNIDYNNYYNNIPEQMIPDINDLILEQKQFVDDDYLLNLHQKLAQIREQRKLTEDSIKILNSRINCLEKENSRTLSKINITNQKTNNRLLTLEQKKNHSREKNEYIKKIENDLKKLKQKNKNFKLERDKGLINSRVNVISKNKLKGQQSKQEKENIENIIRMEELNEQNMKKNNVDVMRSENIANVRIKKLIEIQKKEVMIKDLEEKINAELDRKNELEKNIDKMLQEESETLERINKTEQKQKKLFQDFQKALEGKDNFYNIYNLNNNLNNNEQNVIENENENKNENNDINYNEIEKEQNNNDVEEKEK